MFADNAQMSASEDGSDEDATVQRLFNRALALNKADRWQDAVDGFERVLVRLEREPGEHHELRRRTRVLRIACLEKCEQSDATVAACDEFVALYGHERSDRDDVGLLADTLWIKSRTLNRTGERDREREVNRLLIAEFGQEKPLGPVAGAMYNEAIYLRDDGLGEQAIALWDRLWAHFKDDWPDSAGFTPIRGQLAKSTYLARTGELDRALATCDRMLGECRRRSLPEGEVHMAHRRCVQFAARNQGVGSRLRGLLKRS
jgi:tetratricopeptide (TPR) repeat protein